MGNEVQMEALGRSLINFLMNKKELEEKMGSSFRRIKSIKLVINNQNSKNVKLCVEIGMFSAEFNLNNGLKEKGSCLGLEKYIRDWIERGDVKNEILAIASSK